MLVDKKSSGRENAIELLTEESMWTGSGITIIRIVEVLNVSNVTL